MKSKDYSPISPEHHAALSPEATERAQEANERPRSNAERYNEKEAHQAAENTRHEAIKEALLSKEQGKEKRSHQADRHNASHAITRNDRDMSFEQTMDHVRKELPPNMRPLSKLIHSPLVERASDILGKTIFRPNAILAGGVTAFIAVLGLYFYAKYAGFTLQGSETIVAFAVGWVCGILFDSFKALFIDKR